MEVFEHSLLLLRLHCFENVLKNSCCRLDEVVTSRAADDSFPSLPPSLPYSLPPSLDRMYQLVIESSTSILTDHSCIVTSSHESEPFLTLKSWEKEMKFVIRFNHCLQNKMILVETFLIPSLHLDKLNFDTIFLISS